MPSKTPGRPRSERAHQAILSTAFKLLEEGGLGKVTIEAVATKANVGKPTIYRYWANSLELAMAAVMSKPLGQKRHRKAAGDKDDPFSELANQLGRVIKQFATPAGKQTAILMAAAEVESELSKAFRNQVILKSREQGRDILQTAIDHGFARSDLPMETVLDMIYGPIFYRLLTGHAPLHNTFATEIIEVARRTLKT